jgi:hypothetical protein
MKTTTSVLLFQGLALFTGSIAADLELENDNVPNACRDICQPIVQLTSLCDLDDDNNRDDDRDDDAYERERENAEKVCICTNTSFNVSQVGGLCQSCIEQNGGRTDDMREILVACNITSTASYVPAATSVLSTVSNVVATPTSPASTGGGAGAGNDDNQPDAGSSLGASVGLVTLAAFAAGLFTFAL